MKTNFLTHFDEADLNVSSDVLRPKKKSKGGGKSRTAIAESTNSGGTGASTSRF